MLIREPSGLPTTCVECGGEDGELVRFITVAETTQLRYACWNCGRIQPQSVKQVGWDLESIPIGFDNRQDPQEREKEEVQ